MSSLHRYSGATALWSSDQNEILSLVPHALLCILLFDIIHSCSAVHQEEVEDLKLDVGRYLKTSKICLRVCQIVAIAACWQAVCRVRDPSQPVLNSGIDAQ